MEPTTPEVRQNHDPDSDQYGSSAVKAGDDRWLIGNPTNGGHWADDAYVDGWSVGTFEQPAVVEAEPVEPAPAQ